MAAKQDAVTNTYGALVEVDALARQQFVEPIDDERLVDGAIRGMMFKLDPYSGYLSASELPGFERRTHGDFIGVGIEVGFRDGVPTIIAPIEGSPAAAAGIRAGDALVAINDVEAKGLSIFDIEERLAGRPGSAVFLRVLHSGDTTPQTLRIARGPVTLSAVRGLRRKEDGRWEYFADENQGIAYLRVTSFPDSMIREFDALLGEIVDQGARGFILDLRSNPGGSLEQAVEMADRFIADGVIVSTVTRRRAVQEYLARREGTFTDLELAVLIDHASASSAEIVAGSLQDHDRAVIVGERSFGKGSVQHLIRLNGQEAAVKLTVAYYRLPGGRIIHRTPRNMHSQQWGVKPDVEVARSPASESPRNSTSLEVATAQPTAPNEDDPQLNAALRILRERIRERGSAPRNP